MFALIFVWLIPSDYKLYAYQAPKLDKLAIVAGYAEHTVKTRRWGRGFVIVDMNNHKTHLRCHLKYSNSKYCPPFNSELERNYFTGKKVVAAYDPERSLMFELSSSGQKLMNYHTQKESYQSQKTGHIPLGTIVSCIFFALAFISFRNKHK